LNSADGEFASVKGAVKSAWRKENGFFYLDVTVPGNSTATVFVPTKNYKSITEGDRPVEQVGGVKFLRVEKEYALFQVGSGAYRFKSDW
jgi:alpha-L-rhamnosidase